MCTMKNDAVKRDYIIWYSPRTYTIEINFMRILWNLWNWQFYVGIKFAHLKAIAMDLLRRIKIFLLLLNGEFHTKWHNALLGALKLNRQFFIETNQKIQLKSLFFLSHEWKVLTRGIWQKFFFLATIKPEHKKILRVEL